MTKWMLKCGLAASLALTVSMVGCKDDDDGNGNGNGNGGTDGGQPGEDASTGEDAGTDAGEQVTAEECIGNQPEAVPEDCASCVCNGDAKVANDCGLEPLCWGLISCVQQECPGLTGDERTACAVSNCGDFLGAAPVATPVGEIIAGSCADECVAAPAEDGGLGDAGDEDAGDEDAGDEDAATDEDAGTDGG